MVGRSWWSEVSMAMEILRRKNVREFRKSDFFQILDLEVDCVCHIESDGLQICDGF